MSVSGRHGLAMKICFDTSDYKSFLGGEDILKCLNKTSLMQIQTHSDIKLKLFLVLFLKGHAYAIKADQSIKMLQQVKKRGNDTIDFQCFHFSAEHWPLILIIGSEGGSIICYQNWLTISVIKPTSNCLELCQKLKLFCLWFYETWTFVSSFCFSCCSPLSQNNSSTFKSKGSERIHCLSHVENNGFIII